MTDPLPADVPDKWRALREKLGNEREHEHVLSYDVREVLAERDALSVALRTARADALRLRSLLAVSYAGVLLYTDDGELQDCREQPFIDFKRDSVAEIDDKLMQRMVRALARADPPGGG